VGIDSSVDPRGADAANQNLTNQRVDSVRNALIQAGVPAARIQTGVRGDATLVRDRRLGILISSAN
jgi:outer membrane protein OmpA-like peptidoglycan-associated protein